MTEFFKTVTVPNIEALMEGDDFSNPRFKNCAKCGAFFIERRKGRAFFCSKACSAYVKLKNWRARQRRDS